ncbi:transporter, auxin efflux carrier family protein [Aedoeadaptatus nemausensis]|uniref:Transporter, auxin efflux carrier family protein n=1 Tax=Aedoeadaptatus nemausensis TaxID=2582829 RepID=A0A6V6Y7A0_9FIRM|nr:AEC family transporter [Peptoniphilus nemausensis]CAC9935973.1 transporter, auxin efflux carrier family protein [Peptoniphilus nemausensis]
MTHFLLGLNIIFPIFFVILAGFLAKHKGYLDEHFVSTSTWIVFYVALPLKLFSDIRSAQIQSLPTTYVAYILLGICLVFFATWIAARPFIRDRKKLSAFVHCSFRSNFVYVGYPILESLYGTPSPEHMIVITVFGLTLYNILAIVILTLYSESEDKRLHPGKILLKILKNPMIIAIFIGVLFNILEIPVYAGLDKGIGLLASLCTPLSLLLIGASLSFESVKKDMGLVLTSATIRTILTPLVLIPLGMIMGLSAVELGIAYVFWATPCAINCFIYTREMGGDYELASKIITTSFLFAIVTYPIGIGLLHMLQIL